MTWACIRKWLGRDGAIIVNVIIGKGCTVENKLTLYAGSTYVRSLIFLLIVDFMLSSYVHSVGVMKIAHT